MVDLFCLIYRYFTFFSIIKSTNNISPKLTNQRDVGVRSKEMWEYEAIYNIIVVKSIRHDKIETSICRLTPKDVKDIL
jgi:hypothetical protein